MAFRKALESNVCLHCGASYENTFYVLSCRHKSTVETEYPRSGEVDEIKTDGTSATLSTGDSPFPLSNLVPLILWSPQIFP